MMASDNVIKLPDNMGMETLATIIADIVQIYDIELEYALIAFFMAGLLIANEDSGTTH